MQTPPLHDEREWPYVLTLLPPDLEDSARQSEALVRCRNIPDAAALMRMALAYAVSDLSLKDVAAWANALGVARITGPGLFYRLREAEAWLQYVLAQTLQKQVEAEVESRMRLRVVDATVIHGPRATGTEWRAHVLINPGTGEFRAVELTDAHGGEGYGRYPVSPQEVILGIVLTPRLAAFGRFTRLKLTWWRASTLTPCASVTPSGNASRCRTWKRGYRRSGE